MRRQDRFNDDWMFIEGFDEEATGRLGGGRMVSLPHHAVDLPLNYFDETAYQRAFTYQKPLSWGDEFNGREVSLVFDGAMADAVVYVNGVKVMGHRDGYTPFEVRLTKILDRDNNIITVKVDGSENPEIPPFGGQIDYLTYAGIYRDVWLKVTDPVSIRHAKIEPRAILQDEKSVDIRVVLDNPQNLTIKGHVSVEIADPAGIVVGTAEARIFGEEQSLKVENLTGIDLWSLDNPALYTAHLRLDCDDGHRDAMAIPFGFRMAEFTPNGFLLNGEPLKLRGLNRHQSYPYVGYAMGRRAQERDAEILKYDLKCNIVRTSHYPQSPWFLDHCDRIGLLVMEEIPGWQHIGEKLWKEETIANVRRMIERDWNHASIIMWGVRINESADDPALYSETNVLAKSLDRTRAIGGVRCIENSELIEDVYTMNDFFHVANDDFRGNRPPAPLRDQKTVTGLSDNVPYLVTEFNGHMFPTKKTDSEERQAEHVMRYLQVLDKAYGDPHISGSIGWCMFDYNTHKDFGSGDRICHHGVMDMFREPKFAAFVYRSQCPPTEEIVLMPVTYWARGERAIGGIQPLIILTNCDYIEFQFGDRPGKRVYPDRTQFPHLPYAPVILDDRVVAPDDAGAWGRVWNRGRITGFVAHKAVADVEMAADPVPTTLQILADAPELLASERDEVRIMVRGLDQAGHILPYIDDPISLEVDGPAEILGPDVVTFKAGSAGFWVRGTGDAGTVTVTVYASRFGAQRIVLPVV